MLVSTKKVSTEHCLLGIFVMVLNPTIHQPKMMRSHPEEQMCCFLTRNCIDVDCWQVCSFQQWMGHLIAGSVDETMEKEPYI